MIFLLFSFLKLVEYVYNRNDNPIFETRIVTHKYHPLMNLILLLYFPIIKYIFEAFTVIARNFEKEKDWTKNRSGLEPKKVLGKCHCLDPTFYWYYSFTVPLFPPLFNSVSQKFLNILAQIC